MNGGRGNDTYFVSGQDTIIDDDPTIGNIDTVVFGEGILPKDIILNRIGNHLEISISGKTDKLTIQDYYYSRYNNIEKIQFADGTVWSETEINAQTIYVAGSAGVDILYGTSGVNAMWGLEGNDSIYGYEGDDSIDGGTGDDKLYGDAGNDMLVGGDGNDYLSGGDGNDSIEGGAGNDKLYGGNGIDLLVGGEGNDHMDGGTGSDTYFVSGQDTIYDCDSTIGNIDTVNFECDSLDLIFTKDGYNLKVMQNNTNEQVTIQSWYSGTAYQLEKFKIDNNTILLNTKVDQLIQAMAVFSQDTGMSWSQAIEERPNEVREIISQIWVAQY